MLYLLAIALLILRQIGWMDLSFMMALSPALMAVGFFIAQIAVDGSISHREKNFRGALESHMNDRNNHRV